MNSMWIDSSESIGTVGYLVRTVDNNNRGRESWSLYERPLRTNQSHEARLSGWCGETDNRSRFAEGVWKVASVNKAGDRARLTRLDGEDLVRFLCSDGHPDLVPERLHALRDKIEDEPAVCRHCGWPIAPEGVTLSPDERPDGAKEHRCSDSACIAA